ncbi:MAG: DNA polymerase II large subunit [Thaumarchaeota archaeon]|nr:DNA polymerase II large subunit [Nitrososphaerota archaeon]
MSFSASSSWERSSRLAPFPNHLHPYFKDILSQYEAAHSRAESGRVQGLDSSTNVESRTVFDLADRVNQMLGLDQFEGLAERLRELLKTVGKERAAITISQEIALGKFGIIDTAKALEYGVRTGLAVITDGVTVAPIQGIYSVSIKQNDDNSEYASVSYAGPMRSAGGTEAAFSLVIADVTAKKLGLSNYRAREEEIGRFSEELRVYEREVGNFQYRVTDDDVRATISNLSVEVDGVETDPVEVVVHRNLARVSTDRVRGGALRVLNDGVIGRAHKLAKKLNSLNIAGWEWLDQLKGGTQQSTNETEQAGAHFEEVISGRPVLSSPKRRGGFRLRYGRSMNTGLSTIGIHPALAVLLDYPVVVGTQVKVDIPGKAATIAFVDSLEGPTALFRDGSVKRIESVKEAEVFRDNLVRILDLGDVLISYGDFLENNKPLPPSPYVVEWWAQDLESILPSMPDSEELTTLGIDKARLVQLARNPMQKVTASEALAISRLTKIPLHPYHTPRVDRLSPNDLLELRKELKLEGRDIVIDITSHHIKEALETTLIPHRIEARTAVIEGDAALVLAHLLKLGDEVKPTGSYVDTIELIKDLSGVTIRKQSTTSVGVRVGRPEKAMLRRLKPPVHALFPVGDAGGPARDIMVAAKGEKVNVDVVNMICSSCGRRRLSPRCEECGDPTQRFLTCPRCGRETEEATCPSCKTRTSTHSVTEINLKAKLDFATKKIPHDLFTPIKGVRGLISESKMPEPLEKGILRSKHNVYVYKDGTIRIDATNAPLTHFRPTDIKSDITTLIRIGYERDYKGNPLISQDQILELKPQDIIVPADISEDLLRIANFVDDELVSLYGLPPFYRATKPDELIGKIVVGLAPHTSVGVIGRIIGFATAEVCFANPYWHAAKRRDCDGDGDSLLLLLDALLNFSIEYIPNQIGGLMDTPLLVQPIVLPGEVDEQAHNFDIANKYPKEFYEKSQGYPNAPTVEHLIERIESRLATERQFYDFSFTHDTSAISMKRAHSAYSTLKTLAEKIDKQIDVAEKIDAVSTKEVVESIIKTHLIRDIMGNMKKYATQSFKCRDCGFTYRRPPVDGKCTKCGNELHETLTRASVEKYLGIAQRLARDFDIDDYLKSRLEMAEKELDQLFKTREKSTQTELTDFAVRPLAKEVR